MMTSDVAAAPNEWVGDSTLLPYRTSCLSRCISNQLLPGGGKTLYPSSSYAVAASVTGLACNCAAALPAHATMKNAQAAIRAAPRSVRCRGFVGISSTSLRRPYGPRQHAPGL